jgi:PhnB protein
MAKVNPIPKDYPRVIPYLTVEGATAAIDFYTEVLGATERMRMPGPDGKIGHAELEIGDSVIMLADAFPDMGGQTPASLGGTPVTIMVYVEDVDAVYEKALSKGATPDRKVEDQFYGDRSGSFSDPFGHKWYVASHIEDVPPEEMESRAAAAMGG